ncbi:hypothetical protein GQ457_17G010830 [Hibiscus cannabinus]
MIQKLKEIYEGQVRQERYETSKALFQCKMSEGSPVGARVIKMMGYIQTLEKLSFALNDELAIDVVLESFPDSFNQFVLHFNMNEINKTLPQLLGMLRTVEGNMKRGGSKSILMVREAKGNGKKVAKSKGIDKTKPKGKEALKPKGGISKDGKCFHCGKPGHWKRNCLVYLEDVKKAKAVGASVSGVYVIDVNIERRISKLHKDGLLDPFVFEKIDVCESCFLGEMTKAPFSGKGERASDLLALIHSDVCGPINTQARGGFQYFITFTDDFSRYGKNQHGKNIKTLRFDRGGEYLSQDFDGLLKECGIVSQLTPPGTPQWNGVSERRNQTLLDMVRSMMSHTNLPISFGVIH